MEPITRRQAVLLLGAGAATAATAASVGAMAGPAAAVPAAVPSAVPSAVPGAAAATLTPDQALTRLVNGNRRFVENRVRNPRRDTVRRAEVAQGQTPFVSIISCSDSRVPVEVVFDQGLGDIFGVRDAGNTVSTDPVDFGSVQYGCLELNTPLLMVLGHSGCGAVKAAIEVAGKGTQLPGSLPDVVEPILPAAREALSLPEKEQLPAAILASVRAQVAWILTDPLLSAKVDAHTLKVVGAVYQLHTGKVTFLP